MISGIRHYHYSTRNLSITPEQSTRLARARTSSGVLEHLHVFALPTAVAEAADANTHAFHYHCCCVAVRAKRREEQSDRSQKVLLRVPNGCVSLTKTVVEVDREARQPSCTRTRSRTG